MQAVLDPSVLAAVKKLHQSGRYFDEWRMVEELPPPKIWSDLSAELNAATLIGRLEDSKRASKIVFQAWRDPINHVEAREAMFWEGFSKREAFLSWQSLMQHVPAPDEPVEKQADHEARRPWTKGWHFSPAKDFCTAAFRLPQGTGPSARGFGPGVGGCKCGAGLCGSH